MKHLGKIMVLVAIGVALSLATAIPACAAEGKTSSELVAEAKAAITTITVEEAYEDYYQANQADVAFLDIREADEVEEGHVPGASWIARGFLEFKIASMFPEKDAQTLIVYCRTGGRSSLATQTLQIMGYNVLNLDGGFTAWQDSKYPVRRGAISASGGGCG